MYAQVRECEKSSDTFRVDLFDLSTVVERWNAVMRVRCVVCMQRRLTREITPKSEECRMVYGRDK